MDGRMNGFRSQQWHLKEVARAIFDFYINSSIHVALAIVAFTVLTMLDLQLGLNGQLLAFIFCSSIIGYNVTKYVSGDRFSLDDMNTTEKGILMVSLLSGVLLLYILFTLTWPVILLASLLGLVTVWYNGPVFWGQVHLRKVTGMKIFVIAFVWAAATVMLPVVSAGRPLSKLVWIEGLQRFFFVVALTLPFDIRDVRFDTYQIGTLPQLFGIKKTRIIGLLVLTIVVVLQALKGPFVWDHFLLVTGISVLTGILVMQTVVRQTRYFTAFWIEGIPILWCGLQFVI